MNIFNMITSSGGETSNEAGQVAVDLSKNFNVFLIVSVVVFLFILSIMLTCYILKRSNCFLGVVLSYLIGIAGFFGLFLAKEPEERKEFFLGWVVGYSIKVVYCVGVLLTLFLI